MSNNNLNNIRYFWLKNQKKYIVKFRSKVKIKIRILIHKNF